jgi:hypothetical protein
MSARPPALAASSVRLRKAVLDASDRMREPGQLHNATSPLLSSHSL